MLVLIAEDDGLHRSFARTTIEQLWPDNVEVIEAHSGDMAIEIARKRKPPCVVLDLQLPKATGIEVARSIWAGRADTNILFWSNFADESYVRGVARIVPPGTVYGYVLKSASEEGMRLALRGVFSEGHCIIDREVRGIQHRVQNRLEGITDSEYESLIDLALGLTDKTIAARRGLSTRGAQARIRHLYEKLGVATLDEPADNTTPVFNSRTRRSTLPWLGASSMSTRCGGSSRVWKHGLMRTTRRAASVEEIWSRLCKYTVATAF